MHLDFQAQGDDDGDEGGGGGGGGYGRDSEARQCIKARSAASGGPQHDLAQIQILFLLALNCVWCL